MKHPKPTNNEIKLVKERYIVSRTDTKGIIEYGNDYFSKICGYSKEELIGAPHNIIRHPDMPKVLFKIMWETIERGEDIRAIVKNLTKDGSFYWVVTEFEPKMDPVTNEIVSHTAFRRHVPRKAINTMSAIYMQKTEQIGHPSRNHPATKNGEYPATYDGDDSATFYKVHDFILS